MNEPPAATPVEAFHQTRLNELVWTMEMSGREFSLLLARCNYSSLRSRLVRQLQANSSLNLCQVVLQPADTNIYERIQNSLGSETPDAVMLLGLESVIYRESALTIANHLREEFSKEFSWPLVIWVTDEILSAFLKISPDFKSWGSTVHFDLHPEELIEFLQARTDEIFALVLAGSRALSVCREVELAFQALREREISLEERLEASIAFCFAERLYYQNQISAALDYYRQSLAVWQQLGEGNQDETDRLRTGVVRYCLGLCYRSGEDWQLAAEELQASIDCFAGLQCSEFVARLLGELGELLIRLGDWDKLECLAQTSLEGDGGHLKLRARSYGFLARVALSRQQELVAKQYAQQALETWKQTRESVPAEFFSLLAQALQVLGEKQEALVCLDRGKQEAHPQDNPQTYVNLLYQLHKSYTERGEYLKAFAIKQYRREIRYKFGLRAFIGAGQLQPQRVGEASQMTPALAASGRKRDVESLLGRLSQPRHKLTVLYGPSGVGKSSLVQAGLVPSLPEKVMESHIPLPVVVRAYGNWVRELGKQLALAEESHGGFTIRRQLDSIAALKEQLRQNEAKHRLTVLIFDQFEEFFFVCNQLGERREFYQFLEDCLRGTQIKFVKVILSLREDYLHELLELEEFLERQELETDILRKERRYYLGNFSAKTAQLVIEDLTAQTQLRLEEGLIEAFVEDLGNELGVIRPIELQVAGAQLESKGIYTLDKYRQLGDNPTSDLAAGWIEDVVEDCGGENVEAVWQVLAALTDEKGMRPFKTAAQLEEELEVYRKLKDGEAFSLEDLILKILVGAGLVILWPQEPEDRYQLVHDYLVQPIRQKYDADYRQRLERAEAGWRQAQAALNQWLKKALAGAMVGLVALTGTTVFAVVSAIRARNAEQKALDAAEQARNAEQKAIASQLAAKSERLRETSGRFYGVSGLLAVESANILLEGQWNSLETDLALRNSLKLRSKSSKLFSSNTSVKLSDYSFLSLSLFDFDNMVNFSSDNRWVATSSYDNTARIWDAQTGKEIARLEHDGPVTAVSFNSDNRWVATASWDNTARIWDARTGAEIARLEHDSKVRAVSFSSDNRWVATASQDGTARIWDARTGAEIARLEHDGPVTAVSFSSDNRWVATASWDNTARIWDARTGAEIARLEHDSNLKYDSNVYAVSFSSDNRWVATASRDGTARIWDAQTGAQIVRLNHDSTVSAVSFSRDNRWVATASKDNTARIWDARTGAEIARLEHESHVSAVSFSSDNRWVATASDDHTARIWDARTGAEIARLEHESRVSAISFSRDNRWVATTSWDNTVRIWHPQAGDKIAHLEHERSMIGVFSSDNRWLATISGDNIARIWNAQTGEEIAHLEHEDLEYGEYVREVSFSSDNHWLATASSDGTVRIWNAQMREEIARLNHDQEIFFPPGYYDHTHFYVNAVSFSSDNRWLATASGDNTVRIWNAQTGEVMVRLKHESHVSAVSFSSDNRWLATASGDNTVRIWNAQTGEVMVRLKHESHVSAVSFSSDNRWLATASSDKTARIWDAQTGEQIARLEHDFNVFWISAVSFSSNNHWVATVSNDGIARIWNSQTGKEIARLEYEENVTVVSFSSDNRWVATVSDDGSVRISWVSLKDLSSELCRRLTRNLTADEWQKYIDSPLPTYRRTCPQHPVHPSVLWKAIELAKIGTKEDRRTALAIFRRAQQLQPDIDLDPTTDAQEKDAKALVQKLAASGNK